VNTKIEAIKNAFHREVRRRGIYRSKFNDPAFAGSLTTIISDNDKNGDNDDDCDKKLKIVTNYTKKSMLKGSLFFILLSTLF